MRPIIDIRGLDFSYRPDTPVLQGVSASIEPGALITLLGPNGVGKSTLLGCIAGLLTPQAGVVALNGADITGLPRRTVARTISYVPQRSAVSFDYTVTEFVVMGRAAYMGVFSSPGPEDYKRVRQALEKLDIPDLADRPVSELSGGEQQKVCIARALTQDPDLILMDEPTAALDYGNQIRVLGLVKELSAAGYAVLMTTHDPEHSLLLGSQVWIMDREGGLSCGPAEELITEENLSRLYDADIRVTEVPAAGRRACVIGAL